MQNGSCSGRWLLQKLLFRCEMNRTNGRTARSANTADLDFLIVFLAFKLNGPSFKKMKLFRESVGNFVY